MSNGHLSINMLRRKYEEEHEGNKKMKSLDYECTRLKEVVRPEAI